MAHILNEAASKSPSVPFISLMALWFNFPKPEQRNLSDSDLSPQTGPHPQPHEKCHVLRWSAWPLLSDAPRRRVWLSVSSGSNVRCARSASCWQRKSALATWAIHWCPAIYRRSCRGNNNRSGCRARVIHSLWEVGMTTTYFK